MLIVMKANAPEKEIARVEDVIASQGLEAVRVPGPSRMAICLVGNEGTVPHGPFSGLAGIDRLISVSRPYKLASREVQSEDTRFSIRGVEFGGETPVVAAGPCAVETEARTLEIARAVKGAGASVFRAGAFKPRTNPYSFQGLGSEGLRTLARVREETGLVTVSEVLDAAQVDEVSDHVDILQVGARNMQNTTLLRALAARGAPVLLKRGLAASLEEWLQAAEYLLAGGLGEVILCERGIRTHAAHARNTLDLASVPKVRDVCHLPIFVDPSHGVGERQRVRALSRAAVACGAMGLLIETHTDPELALSDGRQTIDIPGLEGILRDIEVLRALEPLGESAPATVI